MQAMELFKKLNAFTRCFLWGVCPKCNSDAPEIDTCKVCNNYRAFDENKYSTDMRKATWWVRYIKDFEFNKNIKKLL
jgi:hypothetical protein